MVAELRHVSALREVNPHPPVASLQVVVIAELLSEVPRLYADDGVGLRIVARLAPKHFHTNHRLLDLVGASDERLVDDEAEKGDETLGVHE